MREARSTIESVESCEDNTELEESAIDADKETKSLLLDGSFMKFYSGATNLRSQYAKPGQR